MDISLLRDSTDRQRSTGKFARKLQILWPVFVSVKKQGLLKSKNV